MRRRSLITFIIMNVLISLGVAFGVISYFGDREQTSSGVQVVTVEIRVTTTPNPEVSPQVLIVTATPLAGTELAVLPTGLFDDLNTPDLTRSPAPTIDPAIIGEDADLQGTATALPENCIPYALKDGDTPFGIAEEFGADGFLLMEINGLDDTTASLLQIGDILIIPLEGCSLTAADVVGDEAASALSADDEEAVEETEEPTEGPSSTPTRTPIRTNTPTPTFTPSQTSTPSDTPTVTLPPTAANAQIEITGIASAGDVTAEAVTIRNNGNTVDVTGWTLRDNDGNAYTFPEQILFSNATVTIYTRVGDNTPIALYWGRSQGVWGQEGDVITLADEDGLVQSTLRVP